MLCFIIYLVITSLIYQYTSTNIRSRVGYLFYTVTHEAVMYIQHYTYQKLNHIVLHMHILVL